MRRLWGFGQGLGLLFLLAAWAWSAGCVPGLRDPAGEAPAATANDLLPVAFRDALSGYDVGDLVPTNDATFQLQVSQPPTRFIVKMNAPRETVTPAVQAYFRNLGVEDMASIQLFWCESARRGARDIWSCTP